MKGWMGLGVVDTIYEEDDQEDEASCSSPPVSATVFLCLQIKVDAWSRETGLEPDLLVHVQDRCFHLHKEPLISCSVFLRRQLTHASNSSVTIPSSVTAETFATVAAFCYDPDILVTPFNVVPLRVAADILDMADDNDDNLIEKTDNFFDRAVAVNGEIAETVLRSCFRLMPEAEEAASMAGRCIEALLNLTERGNSMSHGWVEAVNGMKLVELFLILDSMRPAKTHDNVYKLVSLYLKENDGLLTEEEKNRIAGYVDCNRLSQRVLVHAVQNPNMPLRMVIQAMLVEQYNTRVSVFSATTSAATLSAAAARKPHKGVTLGAILQRDAALHHVARLKASMAATNERILSLEKDLMGMKERLMESEKREVSDQPVKSASFRFSWEEKRRSVSGTSHDENGCTVGSWKGRSLGRVLLNGMRKVFRTSKSKKGPENSTNSSIAMEGQNVVTQRSVSHRRSLSFG